MKSINHQIGGNPMTYVPGPNPQGYPVSAVPVPVVLPGGGWYAEVSLNGEVMFLRVICFIISGDCIFQQAPGGSVFGTYPKTQAMVSANQAIVPASLVPGFTRLMHESELEEEFLDEEDQADYEDEDGESEAPEEDSCEYEDGDDTLDPP
jgi:hypothetical protein